MRWQQLFADLAGQFDEADLAAERDQVASRSRAEYGRLRLTDRLGGAIGWPVTVRCRGAGEVTGVLIDVGVDWLLLEDDQHRDVLVARAALAAVSGLGAPTVVGEQAGPVRAALDLRRALRALARDRSTVRVVLDDGGDVSGTIDRVGADFLELAEHLPEQPRRSGRVRAVRAVALDAVAVVRTIMPALD